MPKVSFGIIALNAQPFLAYNLRALYPVAHQIIVVEGATRAAAEMANSAGHSTDGTLEMLQAFKATEDPQNKLTIVTANDQGYADGLWPEKDEMSRAYASRATGDWLWQVDSDEFYTDVDMQRILELLDERPELTGISFPFFEFWGGFDYVANGVLYLYELPEVPRVFRWRQGYAYSSHRPPTVVDEKGQDLDRRNWLDGSEMRNLGLYMRHYSYVLPKQARQKVGYYSKVGWTDVFRDNQRWLEEKYLKLKNPLFLNERGFPMLQWLERYKGDHPTQIEKLKRELTSGKEEPLRTIEDIDRLLASPFYALEVGFAKLLLAVFWPLRSLWKRVRSLFTQSETI